MCRLLVSICCEVVSFFESNYRKKEFVYNWYSDENETVVNIVTFSCSSSRYSLLRSQVRIKNIQKTCPDELEYTSQEEDEMFCIEGFLEIVLECKDDAYSGIFQHAVMIDEPKVFLL